MKNNLIQYEGKFEKGGAVVFGIVFFTCLIFYFVAFGIVNSNNSQVATYLNQNNYFGAFASLFSNSISAIIAGISLIAIPATLIFPNPYTLFGGVFGLILSIVTGLSSDVLSSVRGGFGSDLGFILVVTISTLILGLFALDWYKGGRQL